jgi:hypothetical protein
VSNPPRLADIVADDTLALLARLQRLGLEPAVEPMVGTQRTLRVILDGQRAGGGSGCLRIKLTTGRVHDGWLKHGRRDTRLPQQLTFHGPAEAAEAADRYELECARLPAPNTEESPMTTTSTSVLTMVPGLPGRVILHHAPSRETENPTVLAEVELVDRDHSGFLITVGDESILLYATADEDGWMMGAGQYDGQRLPWWPISLEPDPADGIPALFVTLPTEDAPDVTEVEFGDDEDAEDAAGDLDDDESTEG